jgi:hypothetical protein
MRLIEREDAAGAAKRQGERESYEHRKFGSSTDFARLKEHALQRETGALQ